MNTKTRFLIGATFAIALSAAAFAVTPRLALLRVSQTPQKADETIDSEVWDKQLNGVGKQLIADWEGDSYEPRSIREDELAMVDAIVPRLEAILDAKPNWDDFYLGAERRNMVDRNFFNEDAFNGGFAPVIDCYTFVWSSKYHQWIHDPQANGTFGGMDVAFTGLTAVIDTQSGELLCCIASYDPLNPTPDGSIDDRERNDRFILDMLHEHPSAAAGLAEAVEACRGEMRTLSDADNAVLNTTLERFWSICGDSLQAMTPRAFDAAHRYARQHGYTIVETSDFIDLSSDISTALSGEARRMVYVNTAEKGWIQLGVSRYDTVSYVRFLGEVVRD